MAIPITKEVKIADDLLLNVMTQVKNAGTIEDKFNALWIKPENLMQHVNRRIDNGEITSLVDYAQKTFAVLANSAAITVAIPKEGGMIAAKMHLEETDWIVLLAMDGKIITSYPRIIEKKSFEDNETDRGNEIYVITIAKRIAKQLKKLFS